MDQLEIDKVLMTKYDLNIEYLEQKYNVEIDDEDELNSDVVNIAKRLQNLYNV
jgi:hypothetical protein